MKEVEREEHFIFATIMLLANRFQTKLDKYMGDLTLKQWLLLCMSSQFDKEEINVNELAAFVGYTRQNIKKIVDILVKKEYMDIEKSEKDKRSYNVKLTKKAYSYFSEFENLGDELLMKIFKGTSQDELTVTAKTLMKLLDNIEKV
ncbi:MarR family winged helix-turn-helix transcriptional regulator [Anaerosacchariphilus polymeriproducens]|uniref:MarR family transcriptional regulator n=1 Tax=Anaerosacchariphilus polymeriproducens TaxID=1812858 RepID=A0A371AVA6_9FIRM|nr:MarR family transcriptional regulator [Anaerosacchariphilus polymeriproducens]RDU23515.1 MarR family transcriptional regulator [Anaerosacchariphilus polymeriproducens]